MSKGQVDRADQTIVATSPWDGSRQVFRYTGWQEGFPDPVADGVHLWTEVAEGRGGTFSDRHIAEATAKALSARRR